MYKKEKWALIRRVASHQSITDHNAVLMSPLQDADIWPRPMMDYSVEWCDNYFLKLNVNKTKDMTTDFWKHSHSTVPTIFQSIAVETVDCGLFLGTVVDQNQNFDLDETTICKKGLQTWRFLHKLNVFNIENTDGFYLYRSFTRPISAFCLVYWSDNKCAEKIACLLLAREQTDIQQLSFTDTWCRQRIHSTAIKSEKYCEWGVV